MIIEAFTANTIIMKNNKKRMPTDQQLKSYNPADRDFQRTEQQTDRVDQSEIEEQKREQKKQNTKQ
jgi:hypothetical protein